MRPQKQLNRSSRHIDAVCAWVKGLSGLVISLIVLITLGGADPSKAQAVLERNPMPRQDRPGRIGAEKRDLAFTEMPGQVRALAALSVLLGCPTATSITANVMSEQSSDIYIEFGTKPGIYTEKTAIQNIAPTEPIEVLLDHLQPNSRWYYRLRYRNVGQTEFAAIAAQSFHTQRAPGSSFVFELQGDSHPERPQQFDASLYAQTLSLAAADSPDFYITMGDDFSVDTLPELTRKAVAQRYVLQRPYLALVGQRAPIFMVNGNHEQAAQFNLNGTAENVAVWAQTARNRLYPQPAPDSFYSGNGQLVEHIGFLRDYYAWTWGDALFVVIDPYWHSSVPVDNRLGERGKKRDMWGITLGDAQYQWLQQTLESSTAKYKFVLSHHVLGTGRGGIEQADSFEWGGKNRRGDDEFANHRPSWALPIHALMVKNKVTAFFQGHDHVFAHQQLDGITYQTLPQPADPNYALNYGDAYRSGDILPNSGRLRVTVSPVTVKVEYTVPHRQLGFRLQCARIRRNMEISYWQRPCESRPISPKMVSMDHP